MTGNIHAFYMHEKDIWTFATCPYGGHFSHLLSPLMPDTPRGPKAVETQRAGRAVTEPRSSIHPQAELVQTRPPQATRLGVAFFYSQEQGS